MNAHTPGPWQVIGSPSDPWIIAKSGVLVANVRYTNDQTQGDARLIAAAPELLEALVTLYDASIKHEKASLWNDHWASMWESARAVITKAEEATI